MRKRGTINFDRWWYLNIASWRFSIEPPTKSRVNRRRVRRGSTVDWFSNRQRVNILKSGLCSVICGVDEAHTYAHLHEYPRFCASILPCTCARRACFVHVEGGRSIVLASQGCCTRGLGWNRIYSIRCWHINRTDNNTATHPAAEPLPIQFTRRDVPVREMTKIRIV